MSGKPGKVSGKLGKVSGKPWKGSGKLGKGSGKPGKCQGLAKKTTRQSINLPTILYQLLSFHAAPC